MVFEISKKKTTNKQTKPNSNPPKRLCFALKSADVLPTFIRSLQNIVPVFISNELLKEGGGGAGVRRRHLISGSFIDNIIYCLYCFSISEHYGGDFKPRRKKMNRKMG